MQNNNIFAQDEQKAIIAMINETLTKSLGPTIQSIVNTAIAEIRRTYEQQSQIPPVTIPSAAPRQQKQTYAKPTTMSEKQSLFLMHTMERILAKTYEQEKYNTYHHFIGKRTPKETVGITFKYLKHITKITPTENDTNNIENQKAAFKHHLENANNYLKEQKEAAAKMLSFLDCTSPNIKTSIQEALKKANNNTTYIKNAAHKDIYQFLANITIQELHQDLKSSCSNDDYSNFEKYIDISKQLNTLKRKSQISKQHLDNDTLPTYITKNYTLEWHGLPLSEKAKECWETANKEAQEHMLERTRDILKMQINDLKEQLQATNIPESADNTLRIKAILFINRHRQNTTADAETKKSFAIPNSFQKVLREQPFITNTLELADLFQDPNPIEPSFHHIITDTNYTTHIPKNPTITNQAPKPQPQPTTTTTTTQEKIPTKVLLPITNNTPSIKTPTAVKSLNMSISKATLAPKKTPSLPETPSRKRNFDMTKTYEEIEDQEEDDEIIMFDWDTDEIKKTLANNNIITNTPKQQRLSKANDPIGTN